MYITLWCIYAPEAFAVDEDYSLRLGERKG
jgi:hypothetical protein